MTKAWSSCNIQKVQQRRNSGGWEFCGARRDFQPQIFAVGAERFPVSLFKQFNLSSNDNYYAMVGFFVPNRNGMPKFGLKVNQWT